MHKNTLGLGHEMMTVTKEKKTIFLLMILAQQMLSEKANKRIHEIFVFHWTFFARRIAI